MKIKVIRLGTRCRDKATKLDGTLTHWLCNMEGRIDYLFQPRGLDEEGLPVKKIFLEASRLDVGQDVFEEVQVPFEILGTIVTNDASGFTGMAVEFVRHINGCFHVAIQPEGVLPKSKSPIRKTEFDLRECSGDKITELSEAELKRSKEEQPSPTGDSFERITPIGCSSSESSRRE